MTWVILNIECMDSGYDSDCGYGDFTSFPAVQLVAVCTYDEYCQRTAHTKSERKGSKRVTGEHKNKYVINCSASDLKRTKTVLTNIIGAVEVMGTKYHLELARPKRPETVVSNELSINKLDPTCNKYGGLIC